MRARFDEGACDAGLQPKIAVHRSLAQGQGILKNGIISGCDGREIPRGSLGGGR